jgi:hypothetical protein
MAVLVFGNYFETGNEADTFDVGHTPVLDGIDGFFDQSFEMSKAGDELFFLVTDDGLGSEMKVAARNPRRFRDRLDLAPVITGTILDTNRCTYARCRVDRREIFGALYGRKVMPTTNEVLDEIGRYEGIWAGVQSAIERMGSAYRYTLSCQLPPISAVRDCLRLGLVGVERDRESILLVEPLPSSQVVRVIALGDNDIGSSRIFDITDLEEYQATVQRRRDAAVLPDEAKFWTALLASGSG